MIEGGSSNLVVGIGTIIAIAQAGLLFIWNNLRADIKKIDEKVDKKVDQTEFDRQRDNIAELFTNDERLSKEIGDSKIAVIERIHAAELGIRNEVISVLTQKTPRRR